MKPKSEVLFAKIVNTTKCISRKDKIYYRVEVMSYAKTPTLGEVWVEDRNTTLLRLSEDGYNIFLGEATFENMLVLFVEHTVKDVTEYEDKDGVVCKHTETDVVVTKSLQASSDVVIDVIFDIPKYDRYSDNWNSCILRNFIERNKKNNLI